MRSEYDDERSCSDPRVTHHSYEFSDTGETLPYALFVPAISTEQQTIPLPLVVALHGLTRTYDWCMTFEGLLEQAEEKNCIVVCPLGYTRQGWYGSRTICLDGRELPLESEYSQKDVMNVVDIIINAYPVDKSRVFLFGHSMGGGNFVSVLVCMS